jgi:rare lipoprotein A
MNFRIISTAVIIAIILPQSLLANFSDVKSDYEYVNSINSLKENGCISGYADGTFKPENKINRAEALKLILTCLDIPKIYTEETFSVPAGSSYLVNGNEVKINEDSEIKIKVPFNPDKYPALEFRDLSNQEWFIGVLKEALVREIITGYADNTIKAERTVTKGEFFAMLYRVVPSELQKADLSKDLANDALIGQWYTEPLSFFVQNNLLGKDAENNINPFRELNRGQVAHFIYIYKEWLTKRIAGEISEPKPEENKVAKTAPAETTEPTAKSEDQVASADFNETGIASFMGKKITGNPTASGDLYNPDMLTAAHKTLAFGTFVKVTNPANGKWVEVKINDRGPYTEGRVIDLSYSAFEAIAEISQGIVNVNVEATKTSA